mmetsp:Transcript_18051/g.36924  ORF Transcript_18051/g.36924 Transcript_18051/m.36924 type:complete len:316 (+) Transcript_18051:435-1382(+)
MFLWVFALFPGSAYTGFDGHDNFLAWLFATFPLFSSVARTSMLTKYNELGNLPACTHAIPGALWSILAPLQLLPEARAQIGADGHKKAGRVMLCAAAALIVGYYVIDSNNLYADVHDMDGQGGGLAAWVDGMGLLPLPLNLIGVRMLAAFFVVSGAASYHFAKHKDYVRHRTWAFRHVGAGLWVAAQRPVFAAIRLAQAGLLGTQVSTKSGPLAEAYFYAAYSTTLVYLAGAEWLARRPLSAESFGRGPDVSSSRQQGADSTGCDCAAEAERLRRKGPVPGEDRLQMPVDGPLGPMAPRKEASPHREPVTPAESK